MTIEDNTPEKPGYYWVKLNSVPAQATSAIQIVRVYRDLVGRLRAGDYGMLIRANVFVEWLGMVVYPSCH